MWTLGETITLPSGRRVPLTLTADSDRPWAALEVSRLWHVVRDQGPPHRPSVSFYFGGDAMPLQLEEGDALALADALNAVVEIE